MENVVFFKITIHHFFEMISLNTLIQKRRQSGKILVDLIYAIDLPNDMCYEISSYLVHDTRSLVYQQRYYYLFVYKKILEDSLRLISRHTEQVSNPWWFVRFANDHLICKIFCRNCPFCGNYTSVQRHRPQKLYCCCYQMQL